MDRRHVLKVLAASAATIGLTPAQAAALLRPGTARAPSGSYFTDQQRAAMTALADRVIPETDTPGAVAAGVVEYAELIVSEWMRPTERERFMRGLSHLDEHAEAAAGVRFAQAGEARQDAILKGLETEARALADVEGEPPAFFPQAKALVLHGYYTSEVGMLEELGYQPIPGRFDGCADVTSTRTATGGPA